MGRKAGHLALGIGKAAGATLSLIPEEFPERVRLAHVVDILTAAIIKRMAYGRRDGVAVLAEGLVEALAPEDLEGLENVERDDHGHVRIAEVDFGNIVKTQVQKKLTELGMKATIVAKNLGYELRCADPIPFDMEYTRDLGYCAARYVIEGGGNALISIQRGHFVPIPLEKIMDPTTGRMRVRMVDIESDRYKIARSYMIRLRDEDLSREEDLNKLAAVAKLTPSAFKERFGYLTAGEPKPISLTPPST
jgi:6-phosphofructokinase 1